LAKCEHAGDFGPRFIPLARSVSQNNDHRAALERWINERLSAHIVEEKSSAGAEARGSGEACRG
jgi:hypothetical protein